METATASCASSRPSGAGHASQSAVSEIQRGNTVPSLETVERLTLSLGFRTRVVFEELPIDIDAETVFNLEAILRVLAESAPTPTGPLNRAAAG